MQRASPRNETSLEWVKTGYEWSEAEKQDVLKNFAYGRQYGNSSEVGGIGQIEIMALGYRDYDAMMENARDVARGENGIE